MVITVIRTTHDTHRVSGDEINEEMTGCGAAHSTVSVSLHETRAGNSTDFTHFRMNRWEPAFIVMHAVNRPRICELPSFVPFMMVTLLSGTKNGDSSNTCRTYGTHSTTIHQLHVTVIQQRPPADVLRLCFRVTDKAQTCLEQ